MDAVEEIKQRLNIEDVVSEYVELKRSGRNFKGLSPFSNEKSPSFMVSPEKQIWHDFSSGKGGNMFSFVMEMEGLDFKGALEILARKAGIELEQYRGRGGDSRGREKERLYEALEAATHFYQVQFSKNREALAYVFKKRQFTKETALEWRLGYAPNNGTALVDYLKTKKFTEQEIKGAGLSAQRYRGLGDMFRGRIMIPLCDQQGRVIGFTARLLADDPNAPKYINTPQTLLYDKSRHVFGLHLAKEAIRKGKYAVITEGNLDVIMSHQAGVRQVVATAGTALTEYQLKTLGRFSSDVRLSFDADNAGLNATERAIPIASKVNLSLSIISIPSGKDPDELIKQDVSIWRSIIETPQYALDWLIERYSQQLDITTAQGKRQFSDIVLAVVKGLADQVEREHYINHIAQLIGVSTQALDTKLEQKREAAKPVLKVPKVAPSIPDKVISDYLRTENHLLELALKHPPLRKHIRMITPDMLRGDNAKHLLQFLQTHPDFTGGTEHAETLRPLEEYVSMLAVHYEDFYPDTTTYDFDDEIIHLRKKLIDLYVDIETQHLNSQPQTPETDAKRLELINLAMISKRG
jgi:DNA primase